MKQFRDTPYYVTEDGNVYRLRKLGFKKLKSFDCGHEYLRINIFINKIPQQFSVHRLVAECYIPNPDNLPEVNHNDGIKTNNHISNLYWCTSSQNKQHAYDTGLRKIGEEHHKSKLTEEQVKWIRQHYIPRHREFGTRALGRKFKVHPSLIGYVIKNKCWKHI